MWCGGLVFENPRRDGPELAQLLTESPFTRVEVDADENGAVIRAEFPEGNRVLSSQSLRILLERVLEHTGADMRRGPFHPSNYRQDDFLGDLHWNEEYRYWSFVARTGQRGSVEGKIKPPDPAPRPQPPLVGRCLRGLKRIFGRDREEFEREVSALYRSVDITTQIDKARTIVAAIDDFERMWKEGVADHLHDLYNSNWSNGKFVDRTGFLSRIQLTSFSLEPDGRIKAHFDDGNLFLMHLIVVEVDSNGKVADAYLEG